MGQLFAGSSLQAATVHGHRDIVVLLLLHGARVNYEGGYYQTALLASINKGRNEILELLLQHGADSAIVDANNMDALNTAVYEENSFAVERLLAYGAIPTSYISTLGESVMVNAARTWGDKIFKMLLKAGADVNMEGHFGTALYSAAQAGFLDHVQSLLDHGANANIIPEFLSKYTGDIVRVAAREGQSAILSLLLNHGAGFSTKGGGLIYGNALEEAASNGHPKCVEILLERGFDINAHSARFDKGALSAAAQKGHSDIVQLLIRNRINLEGIQSITDDSIQKGHDETALILLNAGPSIVEDQTMWDRALHKAAQSGLGCLARNLCLQGAHVDFTDKSLRVAVANAAKRPKASRLADIEALLQIGADVNSQDYWNSALHVAIEEDDEQVLRLLLKRRADPNTWVK